jgi:hypothetical protein
MKETLTGFAVMAYVLSIIGGFIAVNSGAANPSVLCFIAGSMTHSMVSMVVLYLDSREKAKFEQEFITKLEQQIQKEKIHALNPNN